VHVFLFTKLSATNKLQGLNGEDWHPDTEYWVATKRAEIHVDRVFKY